MTSLAFRAKASHGYDEAFMAACRDELTYDRRTFALGETWLIEDQAAGVLGFSDLRLEGALAELYALFVEPGFQGSGIGTRLWTQAEDRARALGASRIGVDSDPYAVPFYRRMGMVEAGEVPSGSIPGRMLPRLVKAL